MIVNGNAEILFLIDGSISFVEGSLMDLIKAEDITVDKLDIKEKSFKMPGNLPKLLVSEADILLKNAKSRVYLYDYCIEHGSQLILIGEDDALDELMNVTIPAIVLQKFVRPINAKEASDKILSLVKEIRNKQLRKKILVVDDSPTFLRTAMGWLDKDYNVSICPSAFNAIKMISSNKPDLILLDYEMPVCSGAQFLEMLNNEEYGNDIPVIFLTSRSDPETVKEVLSLHPKGYLLKTQPKDAILNAISDFFKKSMLSSYN